MKTCPYGGKHSYTSERKAKQARKTLDKYGHNVKRMRTYQCPNCYLWHLTSRPN